MRRSILNTKFCMLISTFSKVQYFGKSSQITNVRLYCSVWTLKNCLHPMETYIPLKLILWINEFLADFRSQWGPERFLTLQTAGGARINKASPSEINIKLKSLKIFVNIYFLHSWILSQFCQYLLSPFINPCANFHKAWQYGCQALCKIAQDLLTEMNILGK